MIYSSMKHIREFSPRTSRLEERRDEIEYADPEVEFPKSRWKFETLAFCYGFGFLHRIGGDKYDLWFLDLDDFSEEDRFKYFGGDIDDEGNVNPEDPFESGISTIATVEYEADKWSEILGYHTHAPVDDQILTKITADNVDEIIDYISLWMRPMYGWNRGTRFEASKAAAKTAIGHLARLYPQA